MNGDGFGGWIALLWVRIYTAGLPQAARAERIDEIRSDVWEQASDAAGSRLLLAREILRRVLVGVPADLAWRLSVRQPAAPSAAMIDGGPPTTPSEASPALLSVLTGAAWAVVLVLAAWPITASLSFAGGILALAAIAVWALSLRADTEESGPSAWPPILALGLAGVAAGTVFDGERLGLALAAPAALISTGLWVKSLGREAAVAISAPAPLPQSALRAAAASGAAIAIEAPPPGSISRRSLLRFGLWLGLGTGLAAFAATVADFLWSRSPEVFGGPVVAGAPDKFPAGTKTHVVAGRFWLVNLTAEQGGPGFLALWHKCPHLGCTVPWREDFSYTDPISGVAHMGWFRCPCHGSTYDDAGVRVAGPATRSMDRMLVTFDRDSGRLIVETGNITKGATDNAAHALKVDDSLTAPAPVSN